MNYKTYMVVTMPKDNDDMGEAHFYNTENFDEAFDRLNELIAKEGMQLCKMPHNPRPYRVALSMHNVELWVITRDTQLIH